jgi:hypothetical protein
MIKLVKPVLVLQNSTENTLVVTEEDKGHEATRGDADL